MSDVTLVEFLRARLDEAEAAAHAAAAHRTDGLEFRPDTATGDRAGERWSASYDHVLSDWSNGARHRIADVGNFGMDLTQHIALHDPARVLADVASKRRILAQHEPQPSQQGRRVDEECGELERNWPCTTIRLLALGYAWHPDYREEWGR